MSNRRQISTEIFKDPLKLAPALNEVLNKIFETLDGVHQRSMLTVSLQTASTVANTFPIPVSNPGFLVGGINVTKVVDADNPATALGGGVTLQWQNTTAGNIAITNITGLNASTRYNLELELIGAT